MKPSRAAHRLTSASAGFTLIEVLVVVVIIAVVVTAATLAIGGSASRELENAARRAELRVGLACERAMFSGQDVGFSLVDSALRFGYLLPERWLPVPDEDAEVLRARPLGPPQISVTARRDGLPMQSDPIATQPQFVCFSSGELTPFELELASAGVAERWTLSAHIDGSTELTRVEPR
jgi:general secretion pathway protein H